MWPQCQNQTMLCPEVSMCIAHAIIVSSKLALRDRKPTAAEQASLERARVEVAEIRTRQAAEQVQRFNEGRPPRDDIFTQLPEGRVYYIKVGDHIKIGYTKNLSVRLNSYPPNAHLLAVELGGKDVEKERHDQFHAFLAWGREWFTDHAEIRAHIGTLPPLANTGRKLMRRGPANQVPLIKPKYWR